MKEKFNIEDVVADEPQPKKKVNSVVISCNGVDYNLKELPVVPNVKEVFIHTSDVDGNKLGLRYKAKELVEVVNL